MAAKSYVHKSRGFQVRYTLYFPDGRSAIRYRYLPTSAAAESVRRDVEFLERGSRSGSLSAREIVQAIHDGLLSESDAREMSGGRVAAIYTLEKVYQRYLTTISVSHSAVAYKKAAAKAIWIVKWLENHPIPSLTTTMVKQYILDRRNGQLIFKNGRSGFAKSGVRPKTIKNELEIMSAIVEEAIVLGMVESNIVRSVSLPVKTSTLRRSLNKDEVTRLLTCALENKHLLHGQIYEFVAMALYTGFRLSELRTLTWDDINIETQRIFIQSKRLKGEADFNTKSGVARYKSIADILLPVINSIERRGRFVFGGDNMYLPEVLTAVVKKVMGRAGLDPDLSLHHLRHTYGSWLLRMTGDLKYVQDEMGHLDISTTKNYMHNIENKGDPSRTFSYE